MSSNPEQHLCYAVANAPLRSYPFPHLYVEEVFPAEFYAALLENLPPLEQYRPISEGGSVSKGHYDQRYVCSVLDLEEAEAVAGGERTFWTALSIWMHGEPFAQLVCERFVEALAERFGTDVTLDFEVDARLVRDFTNYAIGPHTDSGHKLVSLLFYLPRDDQMRHLGTSLYHPKDPAFRCEGGPHHPFDSFRLVTTMAYRPNTLFAFPKLARSFHGLEPIRENHVARDLLLYNLYLRKGTRMEPRTGAKPTFGVYAG